MRFETEIAFSAPERTDLGFISSGNIVSVLVAGPPVAKI